MENCSVQKLSPQRAEAFFQFFDQVAFSDNPHWASCYCQFYLTDHSQVDWESRTAVQNREAAKNRIDSGSMQGYLAYLGNRVAGWCHAGPKLAFPALANEAGLQTEQDGQVGSIVCFIVAPERRGQGIASQLLESVCLGLAEAGLRYAEGYPRQAAVTQAANYHGPLAMFLGAGFEVLRELEGYNLVRKALA